MNDRCLKELAFWLKNNIDWQKDMPLIFTGAEQARLESILNGNPEVSRLKEKFDTLASELAISAREYFMLLRLAIYHADGIYLQSSTEVAQYKSSDDVYHCAIKLLKQLGDRR